jgi:uncharacterized membrane protein YraQ (UPF0718 family)
MIEALIENTLDLALDSAPWLLFGLIAAGLIRAWLPMGVVGNALGGSGPTAVIKAAVIGAPLPLCSCGVLPAAISLSRAGASRASTTSFLISTPETGVDSVALSWVMLGPIMAILRPLAAIFSAISAGLLVGVVDKGAQRQPVPGLNNSDMVCDDSKECCAQNETGTGKGGIVGFWSRAFDGLKYAFTDLLDDISRWLLLGIVVAGCVVSVVPPSMLVEWGSGLLAMLLMLIISVPMYVCATASTPLAHAMLFAGVSPGTVLVFLLAGPASNIASLALVRREFGSRALAAYLFGICVVTVLLGLILDWVIDAYGVDVLAGTSLREGVSNEGSVIFASICLLILLICGIRPLRNLIAGRKDEDESDCCG